MRNLLRCCTASSDSGEVFVIVIGKTGNSTLLLDNACRMLLSLLKAGGSVVVLCIFEGDFMVMFDKGLSEWKLCTLV
jgi:hypothetical protein